VVVSLAAAGVLAALLGSYIVRSTRLPEPSALVATSDPPQPGPDALALAQRVASAFVEALRAGDAAGAYAQMARPYRESATLATFRAAWGTPLLAGPRSISLSRTFESATPIDGKLTRSATFTARGVLVCAAGALDTTLTFLREGDDARVLAVFVGGVPIVQGVGPGLGSPP
jgi:hypothetical protein